MVIARGPCWRPAQAPGRERRKARNPGTHSIKQWRGGRKDAGFWKRGGSTEPGYVAFEGWGWGVCGSLFWMRFLGWWLGDIVRYNFGLASRGGAGLQFAENGLSCCAAPLSGGSSTVNRLCLALPHLDDVVAAAAKRSIAVYAIVTPLLRVARAGRDRQRHGAAQGRIPAAHRLVQVPRRVQPPVAAHPRTESAPVWWRSPPAITRKAWRRRRKSSASRPPSSCRRTRRPLNSPIPAPTARKSSPTTG